MPFAAKLNWGLPMKEKFKSIGSVLLGVGISVGVILLAAFFIKGGLWLSDILFPWLTWISNIAFLICILILLPLAIFRKTRGFSGLSLYISSYIFGTTLWVSAFLLTYELWGATALFIGLFMGGIGIVPIAVLATLFHAEWLWFAQIIFLLILTFGSRMLGLYLSEKADEASYEVV